MCSSLCINYQASAIRKYASQALMAPPRILLCGDVLGRLYPIPIAGPFDALLCVGQFMNYVEGLSQIPIPTYFIGDYGVGAAKFLVAASNNSASQGFKMDGFKITNNLFWLKGSGIFTLHGLSVAYFSGRRSSDGQQFGTYSQDDVDALGALAEEPGIVDFFLTNEWPSGVTNRAATSDISVEISDSSSSDSTVSELVAEIKRFKPCYHIAGSKGVFYAHEPYSNVGALHVTRFLSLAPVGKKHKQAVPIPTSNATAVQDIFNLAAEKLGFKYLAMKSINNSDGRRSLRTQFDRNCSFFYLELPGDRLLSHVVEENERFPAQFELEVLVGLLNIADKADWRNSLLSKEEQMKMADDFKKQFEEFDPNQ